MEKVFVNSQGKVLATGGEALKVTASIDSNIIPSNIKKDVNILGVTGTYEGDSSGSSGGGLTTFYPCSTSNGAKGNSGGHSDPGAPGTYITFYVQYPSIDNKVPDMFIVYDVNKTFTAGNLNYVILKNGQDVGDYYYNGSTGFSISITSLTSTLATLLYQNGAISGATFDTSSFYFAPIYLT